MRMVTIKSLENLGVFKDMVKLQVVDGNVEAVILEIEGRCLRIVSNDTYSRNLQLLAEEPKQEKAMWRVKGSVGDIDISPKEFDDEYDAKAYIINCAGKLAYGEDHELVVEPFSILTDGAKI